MALAGFAVPGVRAWGAAGHEIVATIAQIYTQPVALERACQILRDYDYTNDYSDDTMINTESDWQANPNNWPCHLSSIATWADRFKYRMRWSAPLHYVGAVGDHPSDVCMFPGLDGWAGKPDINLLGGIANTSTILLSYADGESHNVALAQEALKFIVHFLGDLHMPLHLTGRDRGGNGVSVCWEGRKTNFHSVWDGLVVAKAIRTVRSNYTRPLPGGFEQVERNLKGAIYDPLIRRIIWEGVEGRWAEEVMDWVTCPGVYKKEGEEERITVWRVLRDFFLPGWFTDEAQAPRTDTDFICPYSWAKPIHLLNCELIWPKELETGGSAKPRNARCKKYPHSDSFDEEEDNGLKGEEVGEPPYELDNPKYMGDIEKRMLLEQFLAQGGLRLAAALNYIFGDPEGPSLHGL
ncbi:phospholipase C/P1 nuclease [Macrolepiota fuliginosa MF-IS2]|uniref:Phospholipase C/P1 nuclease n=1 Tax=Macrolepiota fuliginosa MF-IS2 TaxID=1400762 RepID=A0A9P6C1U0_9AGAR|nr:phospholipase C/P1 nuclease [Macrolepiota fuliginosa MF-IS2]